MPLYRIHLRQEHREVTRASLTVEAESRAEACAQVRQSRDIYEACRAWGGEPHERADDTPMEIESVALDTDPNQLAMFAREEV